MPFILALFKFKETDHFKSYCYSRCYGAYHHPAVEFALVLQTGLLINQALAFTFSE
jgi:hypothetical protein